VPHHLRSSVFPIAHNVYPVHHASSATIPFSFMLGNTTALDSGRMIKYPIQYAALHLSNLAIFSFSIWIVGYIASDLQYWLISDNTLWFQWLNYAWFSLIFVWCLTLRYANNTNGPMISSVLLARWSIGFSTLTMTYATQLLMYCLTSR
jgi:hypothetical protein